MPTHSIYSVRDKRKVDAEVIDVREVSGAKGVRYQIVGRHPEDGTTVTTFCSAAVAEDFRDQLASIPHGLSAEGVEVDHIPEPEAPVVSTDGTPIDDDLDTFVEDPLVGSATAGTITSAKVLAAEGGLSKTSCCCGATEDDPCACMTADEPMQCSSTEPKCACYAAKGAEGVSKAAESGDSVWVLILSTEGINEMGGVYSSKDKAKRAFTKHLKDLGGDPADVDFDSYSMTVWYDNEDPSLAYHSIMMYEEKLDSDFERYASETVAGIDVQTPSQIAVETPDSDELVVPDPDLLLNGDGRVLGQQTGAVNTTPLHAEEDDIAHASDRSEMIMQEHIEKGIVKEDEYYTLDSDGNLIETDDDPSGFTERGREVFESFYSALVEGTDESDICYLCGTTDDVNECWTCDTAYCIECDPDEMRSGSDGHTYCHAHGPGHKAAEGGRDFDNPDARTFTPEEALEYLRSGDNCVWLIDYSEHNYGDEEYPHYDYPIEDPDELETMIFEGVFDDHEQFGEITIANDTSYALGYWKDQPGGKHPSYVEFDADSNFSGHTEDQVTYIKRKGYEPDMVCSDCFSCFEDGEHSCKSGGLCGCSWEEIDEYDAEPALARNKRVLVPTAIIGGLALAYLAKPELLSGSFDRISDLLGKLTTRKEE